MTDIIFSVGNTKVNESLFLSSWGYMPNKMIQILFFTKNLRCCSFCCFKSPYCLYLYLYFPYCLYLAWRACLPHGPCRVGPVGRTSAWGSQNNCKAVTVVFISYNSLLIQESQTLKNNTHPISFWVPQMEVTESIY